MDIKKFLSLANLIPYVGAKKDVDLGSHTIKAGNLSGTNTGDQDLSGLVPYSGADQDLNMGSHGIIQASFKLTTSPADGKVLTSDANGQGTWKDPPSGWNNSCVAIHDSQDQSIGSGDNVKEFDTVDYDELGEADIANNRITVQEAGYYLIIGSARCSDDIGTSNIVGRITVNGDDKYPVIADSMGGNFPCLCVAIIDILNAGDYIQLLIYNSTGSSHTLAGAWNGLIVRRVL